MRRAGRLAAAALSALAACTTREQPAPAATAESAASQSPAVVAPEPRDCALDTTARHADPVALVEEYVRRDAEGPMEREDIAARWLEGALDCAARATSEHREVIGGFRVAPGRLAADTAEVLVTRDRIFLVAPAASGAGATLRDDRRSWVDTVVALRTAHGWRIHRLHPGSHAYAGHALATFQSLGAADRARLERLAATQPGG